MNRPKLLDLFCCQGGAAMGYHRAGFEVLGVDIEPQPRYPFEFVEADALEFLAEYGRDFDVVHASPPCQTYSMMSQCRPGLADTYPDLIAPTRAALQAVGGPWVIENVVGSDVAPHVMLCGTMFALPLYRHRLFEFDDVYQHTAPMHPAHRIKASRAGHWNPGTIISVSGNCSPIAEARKAMGGIEWMNRNGLAESIPPAYTEFIGAQMLDRLRQVAA